jgi:CheY-like chemotaxis protein
MDAKACATAPACLNEIQNAANRGANLTRQLLLFSRRQKPQPRELDLSDSITGMTKMLRRVLGEDIQIQFKYAPQPLFIHADAGMMDQVLMNLTLNSRDAMPGGGQLIIETAAVELDELAALQSAQARPGSFVRLGVSDTGCGIRPEVLPHIFEPFFTTKDVGKGTGLGLATVFSIVQQHDGWIQVASQPGRGTTFDIYLPRLAKDSVPAAETCAGLGGIAGGNETILLVEDDDALRGSVGRCLSQLGYCLVEAANGAAALEAWQRHRAAIQMLLTDLIMPGGMTGRALGEQLLREKPALQILYMSGYSADVLTRDFPPRPNVTFLPKPFPAQTLARTVRACLDKTCLDKP